MFDTKKATVFSKFVIINSAIKSVKRFIAEHPVFFLALCFWLIIICLGPEIVFTYAFLLSPVLLVVYIVLLSLFNIKSLRGVVAFLWAFPAAMFLIVVMTFLTGFIFAQTYVYRLGIDVQTPDGVVSKSTMVKIRDTTNPIGVFRSLSPGRRKVKSEAVYCDLGNGRNLIALLGFEDKGCWVLARLPWKMKGRDVGRSEKFLPFYGERIQLSDEFTPILVSLEDVDDPMTMRRVHPSDLSAILGEGYSFLGAWIEMTHDSYRGGGIYEALPWVRTRQDLWRKVLFHSLNLRGLCGPFERRS